MENDPKVIEAVRAWRCGRLSTSDAAHVVVESLSDPTNPANRLKRSAKSECLHCTGTYTRTLSVLADSGFCSARCGHEWQTFVKEVVAS